MTPELTEFLTAASRLVWTLPLRLMLATAGLVRFAVTQSMPAMTPEVEPLPPQSSTRTAWMVTPLATP